MYRTTYLIVLILLTLAPLTILAATGRILDEAEAKQADSTALAAEAGLFKSIGQGIALSLAQCEGQSDCQPAVSKDELDHLLVTLENRINDLVTRLERQQGDYNEILTAYVNQREAYLGYQADLEKITGGGAGEEDLGEDTFSGTPATSGEATAAETPAQQAEESVTASPEAETEGAGEEMDIFSDVEEKLE